MLFRIFMSIVVVSLVFAPVGVSAQELPNATETETPNGGGIVVDDTVRLSEWEYRDGTFYLTLEADRTAVLTITEVIQPERGAGEMSIRRTRIASGTSTVEIDVERVAGQAAVAITTSRSLEDGRGVYVSTGQTATGGPFEATTSTAGWFGGASVVLFMFVAAGVRAKRKVRDKPENFK